MAIRNANLGGSDFFDGEVCDAADLNDTNDAIGYVPVGTILPWAKSLTGVPTLLSDSFVECNGQTLSDVDSPLNGQTIPDLNGSSGDQRFLRGGTTSGTTGGADTHSHSVSLPSTGNLELAYGESSISHRNDNTTTGTSDSKPPFYEVVFIMRVK